MEPRSPVGMPLLPPGGGLAVSEPWHASRYSGSQFFVYEVDLPRGVLISPTGQNIDTTFQIQNDSDFFWTELNAFALDPSDDAPTFGSQLLPSLVIQITDIATGRQYDSTPPELGGFVSGGVLVGTQAVPFGNVTGTAQLPFIVPGEVVLWERNSVLKVTVNDVGATGFYDFVQLSFIGVKAFY